MVDDSKPEVAAEDSDVLKQIWRHLLPTPAVSLSRATPIPSDCELLIQRLLGTVHPVQPVVQERSSLTDIEILLQSLAGCFVVSWATRLRGALCWMSRSLSCHRDGGRIGWTMNLYYVRPRGGLTVSKRGKSTDPGRGVGRPDQ